MADKKVVDKLLLPTGPNPKRTIKEVYDQLRRGTCKVVTTGYGRDLLETADKKVTEIKCHAKGANFLDPSIRTIIDIGGQDSKVISLNHQGEVIDFLMNDKCAAGTGRFIEMVLSLLRQDLEDLDAFVASATPVQITSMCAVFAQSEVVSLLAQDVKGQNIALGIVEAVAQRTAHLAMRLALEEGVFFSGGLSNTLVLKKALERQLHLPVKNHPDGQFIGALGAAILASEI